MTKPTRALFTVLLLSGGTVLIVFLSSRSLADAPYQYALAVLAASALMGALAFGIARNLGVTIIKRILRVGVAVIVGVFGLFPLGSAFDYLNWPFFHTWGLAHGAFVIAVGQMAWLVHWLLGWAPWFHDGAV